MVAKMEVFLVIFLFHPRPHFLLGSLDRKYCNWIHVHVNVFFLKLWKIQVWNPENLNILFSVLQNWSKSAFNHLNLYLHKCDFRLQLDMYTVLWETQVQQSQTSLDQWNKWLWLIIQLKIYTSWLLVHQRYMILHIQSLIQNIRRRPSDLTYSGTWGRLDALEFDYYSRQTQC